MVTAHSRMRRQAVKLWLVLLVAALFLEACGQQPHQLSGMVWNQPRAIPFTLTDQRGQEFKLDNVKGNAVLLFFGYTSCPDVCPTTMADFVQVKQRLGQDGLHTRFVLISVDPQRDTQAVLARYVDRFDEGFIGLRGDLEQVKQVTTAFGITAMQPSEANTMSQQEVPHDSSIWLLDTRGRIRTIYPQGTPSDVMAADIRAILNEDR